MRRFSPSLALGLLVTLLCAATFAWATGVAYPTWWTDYGVVPAQPPPGPGQTGYNETTYNAWVAQNYLPANLGQLKNFAAQAQAYLDNNLAAIGGAGPDIGNLVANFSVNSANNLSPVNLGQIKAVAQPIYDRLYAIGFNASTGLAANYGLTGLSGNWNGTFHYPWPVPPPSSGNMGYNVTTYNAWVAQNYQPSNLGQLKAVFSFDLGNFTPAANLSVAGDGIPDWWKVLNGLSPFAGNLDTHHDFGNGRTDYEQYLFDLNHYNWSVTGGNVGNISSFQSSYTTSSTTPATVPADFVASGNIDFPRQPVLQYAVVDLGANTLQGEYYQQGGMDDYGDVLLFDSTEYGDGDYYGYEAVYYSEGNTTTLPDTDTADGVTYTYIWESFGTDGTVYGEYSGSDGSSGYATWDVDSGVDYLDLDYLTGQLNDYLPDGAEDPSLYFQQVDAYGDVYFWYVYQYANGHDGNVGIDGVAINYEAFPLLWNTDDSLTPLTTDGDGNPAPILTLGSYGTDSLDDTEVDIAIDTAQTPQGDIMTLTAAYTYGNISDGALDGSLYWVITNEPATTWSLNGVDQPEGSQWFGPIGNVTGPDGAPQAPFALSDGDDSLYYASSGNTFGTANLTANANSTAELTFGQINPLGLGVPYDAPGQLWLNGQALGWADLLPSADVNDDLSLNASAMLPAVSWGANATLSVSAVAQSNMNALAMVTDDSFNARPVLLVPASLAVDNNRDGNISFDVDDQTSDTKPFRFWLNDDDGSGNTSGDDVPQGAGNGNAFNESSDTGAFCVNGAKDLVNYFPVYLNIGQLVHEFPPSANYTYKLSQADEAVNFLYTNLTLASAFDYLRNSTVLTGNSGFGETYESDEVCTQGVTGAIKHPIGNISSGGYTLSGNFVSNITTNTTTSWGVILVDGRATTNNPLVLTVYNSGNVAVASVSLALNIGNIEDMYREINLRSGAGIPRASTIDGPGLVSATTNDVSDFGRGTNVGPPPNFPDGNGSPWIFFVHGYNVGGDKARGFAAEIFKNLYWSQNRAKFVAVSWFGDPYDSTSPVDMVSDYQMAVRNAFTTAPFLARYLNSPTFSGNKTIIGHSLGCMLVSSAIADYGLTVNNAILVDAAVSREAFDGDGDQDYYYMASPAWENLTGGEGNTTATYDRRLWASNWYQRFSSGDARSNLTWLNRLAGANSKIYNFYSSTEDILGATSGSASSGVLSSLWASGFNGQYAWVVQEKAKGNKQSFLDITPIAGSDYGGWGFNVEDAYLPSPYWSTANTTSANTTSLNYAKTSPFFNNGWALFDNDLGGTTLGTIPHTNDYRNLFDPSPGGLATLPYYQLNRFLAEAFPALSLPAGANSVNAVAPSGLGNPGDRNFNMPAKFVPDETHWPRQPVVGGIPDWFHSDMKAVAYPYLYPLYDKFIEISNQ